MVSPRDRMLWGRPCRPSPRPPMSSTLRAEDWRTPSPAGSCRCSFRWCQFALTSVW